MNKPTTEKLPFDRCAEAHGAIVVLDVLRAFSTAAYAFSRGAEVIFPVRTIPEAFALKSEDPALMLMGEQDWLRIEGFDFGNSPADVTNADLKNGRLVLRTSAGTQGLLDVPATSALFAASFVCARATASALRALSVEHVSFIISGTIHGQPAEEDEACADYITALLEGEDPDPKPYLATVASSHAGRKFLDPAEKCHAPGDVWLCSRVNDFPFAMRAETLHGRMVLRPIFDE